MRKRVEKMRLRKLMAVAAGAMLAVVLAAPAFAHVTVTPGQAAVGSYSVLTFTATHGCDGSPTTEMSVQIPAGVTGVKAEPVAGWEVSYEIGELPEPVGEGDDAITEGVTVVTWSGGTLPDDQIQRYSMQVKLPDDGAGETLWFPVVQSCEEGENAWINIPEEGQDPHDIDEPAPGVTLVAADDGHHGADGEDAMDDEAMEDGSDGAAAEEAAAPADGEASAAADTSSDGDDGTDTLTWVALVLGVLGLAAGGFALVRSQSR